MSELLGKDRKEVLAEEEGDRRAAIFFNRRGTWRRGTRLSTSMPFGT